MTGGERVLALGLGIVTTALWIQQISQRSSDGAFDTRSPWPAALIVATTGCLFAELAIRANRDRARRVAVGVAVGAVAIAFTASLLVDGHALATGGAILGTIIAGAYLVIRTSRPKGADSLPACRVVRGGPAAPHSRGARDG